MRHKLLIITHDVVEERMAGPAIRCWELARSLSAVADVTLSSQHPITRSHPDFAVTTFKNDDGKLLAQAEAADILLVQGLMLHAHPRLAELGKYLVVDLYDPFVFESYPYFESQGDRRDQTYLEVLRAMDDQMRVGDYFLCASDRQRDMWLGRFCALARLTPEVFALDPAMNRLLAIVPFGLQKEPVTASKPVVRGVMPGVDEHDFVLLWGGGVWNWFDAPTVVAAVAALAAEGRRVKLVFMGLKHPNPEIPEMAMATRTVALAKELGAEGKSVFFNHGWVDYDERQNYLAEADAGISAHFDSLETRFSFRTRVLDYFWGGLPVLTTEGDGMAELVARERLGLVIGYEDVDGWKAAIARLMDERAETAAMASRVRDFAPRFAWDEVAKPLMAYVQAPYRTPRCLEPAPPRPGLLTKSLTVIEQEGPREFLRKGIGYLAKKVRR
ncbi:MAG: family 2 glycosyl transferase [Cyanobacteria bacterium RYN_339]|nr:family 2 glycosyl transferase [Cyanobacteria bacterium RYN_339]